MHPLYTAGVKMQPLDTPTLAEYSASDSHRGLSPAVAAALLAASAAAAPSGAAMADCRTVISCW